MKLDKTENIVKKVLEEYEDSRNDNFVLVFRVYKEINEDLVIRNLFCTVMLNHNEYGLPAFETVVRCRRKLQAKHKELRANEKVEEARTNLEEEYREYSRR